MKISTNSQLYKFVAEHNKIYSRVTSCEFLWLIVQTFLKVIATRMLIGLCILEFILQIHCLIVFHHIALGDSFENGTFLFWVNSIPLLTLGLTIFVLGAMIAGFLGIAIIVTIVYPFIFIFEKLFKNKFHRVCQFVEFTK